MSSYQPIPGSTRNPDDGTSRARTRRLSEKRNERYVDEAPLRHKVTKVAVSLGQTVSPTLRQPNVWSGLLAVLLVIVVLGQGTLAKTLGTAGHAVKHAATATHNVTPQAAVPVPEHLGPALTHVARDPFRPLVSIAGVKLKQITLAQEERLFQEAANAGATGGQHNLPQPRAPAGCSATTVVVHSGQSLWSISADHLATTGYHNITTAWRALYAANKSTIGANPDLIRPGQHLCLPTT
jgi:LysM domain